MDSTEPVTEVVGLTDNEYAELPIEQQDVPTTPFTAIVTRGGNNPGGKFILLE
jgi:hypothetical protein